ncbi:MAG: hypothetical protein GX640_13375, partial [Fibrobacter sp.]|nr:hypothetical protein [Fibrobacter sp.]
DQVFSPDFDYSKYSAFAIINDNTEDTPLLTDTVLSQIKATAQLPEPAKVVYYNPESSFTFYLREPFSAE